MVGLDWCAAFLFEPLHALGLCEEVAERGVDSCHRNLELDGAA